MVNVKKRNGELVPFDPERIVNALERSGTSKNLIRKILIELKPTLYEGISTDKIYKTVFRLLKKKQKPAASRFGLKTAISKLGPRGYNFETFICHILREKGYKTNVRNSLEGKCVTHEVDVIAHKGNNKFIAECKFHNQPWIYCPIQDALYTYARYLDVVSNKKNNITKVMLITNTRFSSEVVKYAKCVGMQLLGWKYPSNQGLEKIVDKKAIYPITVLQTPTKFQTQRLLQNNIVIIKDIEGLDSVKLQGMLKTTPGVARKIKQEVKELLKQ